GGSLSRRSRRDWLVGKQSGAESIWIPPPSYILRLDSSRRAVKRVDRPPSGRLVEQSRQLGRRQLPRQAAVGELRAHHLSIPLEDDPLPVLRTLIEEDGKGGLLHPYLPDSPHGILPVTKLGLQRGGEQITIRQLGRTQPGAHPVVRVLLVVEE